jgi:hypothetical protein
MEAVKTLADIGDERGAIFTPRELADFVTGLADHIAANVARG